jgi:hypothetical protein
MMQQEYDFDDVLRRALRRTADSIEPAGDGLERIRARLTTPRPLPAAWLMAGYAEAVMWLRSALDGVLAWFQPAPSGGRPGGHGRFTHYAGRVKQALAALAPGHLAQRYGWLRTVAIACAVLVAGAGGYGLTQLRSAVSDTGVVILQLPGLSQQTHAGTPDSNRNSPLGPSTTPGTGPGHHHAQPSSSASCPPALGEAPRPRVTPSPTVAPTVTPTPTPTPSGTPTGTPTSTPTTSPSATPTTTDGSGTAGSPGASPNGVVYQGPVNPTGSPQSTTNTNPPITRPCSSVHGPLAPGQRTVPSATKHQVAQRAS